MSDLTVDLAEIPKDFAKIQLIRYEVFQLEQGVPPELEFDGEDEQAEHLIAYLNGKPVGTARIKFLTSGIAKIQRLAVLKEARGAGIGRKIMEKALEFLTAKNIWEVQIHAQEYVKDFYQSLGFVPEGKIFEEAGIPHVKMRKNQSR